MTSSRQPATQPQHPWTGETYYGRPQLKPAPFNPWVVGGYIFLAGLSGSSALIGAVAEAGAGPRHRTRETPAPLVRRSRYLALLAPTIGSALLIHDLHTPNRFYNMFRIAKATSPMSIGTWILMSFSAFAGTSGLAQMVSDVKPRWRWPRHVASVAQIPAAVSGAGLSVYTASLLSATSTPLWAAAPRGTAARFAASSMAAAAAALLLGERASARRRGLSNILLMALTTELAATVGVNERCRKAGIDAGRSGPWGKVEKVVANGAGVLLPASCLVASGLGGRESGTLIRAAGVLALAGSALMRVSVLGAGAESASRPSISMRFAQPDNLPDA